MKMLRLRRKPVPRPPAWTTYPRIVELVRTGVLIPPRVDKDSLPMPERIYVPGGVSHYVSEMRG